MELDEAIIHAETVAKGQCGPCAEDHAQLAAWLKELKERRETEAETVRHGYWIEENGVQICSECGEEHDWDEYRAPYCETCGAKMGKKMGEDIEG